MEKDCAKNGSIAFDFFMAHMVQGRKQARMTCYDKKKSFIYCVLLTSVLSKDHIQTVKEYRKENLNSVNQRKKACQRHHG